jgi:hypothetical protein
MNPKIEELILAIRIVCRVYAASTEKVSRIVALIDEAEKRLKEGKNAG